MFPVWRKCVFLDDGNPVAHIYLPFVRWNLDQCKHNGKKVTVVIRLTCNMTQLLLLIKQDLTHWRRHDNGMFRTGRYDATAAQHDHLTLSSKYIVKTVRPASKIEAVKGLHCALLSYVNAWLRKQISNLWSLLGNNAFCVL